MCKLIKELQEAKNNYLSILDKIENSKVGTEAKVTASKIIEETQIHESITLEVIAS